MTYLVLKSVEQPLPEESVAVWQVPTKSVEQVSVTSLPKVFVVSLNP